MHWADRAYSACPPAVLSGSGLGNGFSRFANFLFAQLLGGREKAADAFCSSL